MTVTQPMASSLDRQKTRLIFVVVCGPEDGSNGVSNWVGISYHLSIAIHASMFIHIHIHHGLQALPRSHWSWAPWPPASEVSEVWLGCQKEYFDEGLGNIARRQGDVTSPLEMVRFWVIVVGRTTWLWHEFTASKKNNWWTIGMKIHHVAQCKTEASTSCSVLKANQSWINNQSIHMDCTDWTWTKRINNFSKAAKESPVSPSRPNSKRLSNSSRGQSRHAMIQTICTSEDFTKGASVDGRRLCCFSWMLTIDWVRVKSNIYVFFYLFLE